ncbi:MAG: glycosyltransferase [Syntrophaceae bacterium]
MKVLALIQGITVAASRYRILQYLPYLEEQGIQTDVREFPRTLGQYARLYQAAAAYDCIFVQRKRFHFPFLKPLRQRARRIVYDLDDAVMYKNSLAGRPYSRTRRARFEAMVRASDYVVAGNSFLRDQTFAYNDHVTLIPTSIPADCYSLKDYTQAKAVVTIGWIGDHGSIHYLEAMQPVFEEIGRRFPGKVELKIICDVFFDCTHIPVRKVMWDAASEVEELKDIDIGVMPLKDDPWSWGKCGLKILQYFGVGVPAVCTPVGVNRDVVSPGHNGAWAKTPQEWVEALTRFIEDGDLRRTSGLAGRLTLKQGYTREVNAPKLLSVITGSER